ncbi:MAG: hypothetical protein ACOVQE_00975 [Chitinophagaceae bacterium]
MFKKLIASKLLLLLIIGSFSACYYDKAQLTYPASSTTCDTTATTYAKDIAPLLDASCNSCHGGTASLGGGIKLGSYADAKASAQTNRLLNSVLQNGLASAMPKGGTKWSTCNINKLKSWINKGYPQ